VASRIDALLQTHVEPREDRMNLSGIAVTAAPPHLDAVIAALGALPGVEVRHVDPSTGRIAVVQEAADVAAEANGFRRIRALPHVIDAALVAHHFEPWVGPPDGEPSAAPHAPEPLPHAPHPPFPPEDLP
jgi:nitrate reductase NapAB chaperone NapD